MFRAGYSSIIFLRKCIIVSVHKPVNLRLVRWILLIFLVGVIVLVIVKSLVSPQSPISYGTVIEPPLTIKPFKLRSHRDQFIDIANLREKVVVVTFIYTGCVDVCPVIVEKLKAVVDKFDSRNASIDVLAITTDPVRDDIQRIKDYSTFHDLDDKWHLLIGNQDELQNVWDEFFIEVISRKSDAHDSKEVRVEYDKLLTGEALDRVNSSIAKFSDSYIVDHSTPVFLVDKDGDIRFLMPADFVPTELHHNLNLLLNE